MADNQKSSQFLPSLKRLWLRGFMMGLGVVLVGFLVWFFIRGAPSSPISLKDGKAPQVQTQAGKSPSSAQQVAPAPPAEPAALLQSQLQQVLAEIREANLKKDLPKLLSYYSPNFQGLTQRTQSISKAWKIYDYPKIEFEIEKIKVLSNNTAIAWVKWDAEAKNISTKKSKNISKTYLIGFVKESGQWRIQTLETVK